MLAFFGCISSHFRRIIFTVKVVIFVVQNSKSLKNLNTHEFQDPFNFSYSASFTLSLFTATDAIQYQNIDNGHPWAEWPGEQPLYSRFLKSST